MPRDAYGSTLAPWLCIRYLQPSDETVHTLQLEALPPALGDIEMWAAGGVSSNEVSRLKKKPVWAADWIEMFEPTIYNKKYGFVFQSRKLRCINYSLNRTRCFYQLAVTTRCTKQSDEAALSEVAFSVIVMFDFRLECWLDIAMLAPCPYFGFCDSSVSSDTYISRKFCLVKQNGGSTPIHDLRMEASEDYKALGGQPALFMWQRSMRCGLEN